MRLGGVDVNAVLCSHGLDTLQALGEAPCHLAAATIKGGGGLFKFETPFPPLDPPKFSIPCCSNLRLLGKVLASKAHDFFLALLRADPFFYRMFLYSEYTEFHGEFKNG